MSDARDQILARIRGALGDVPAGERADDVPVAREYRRAGSAGVDELVELLTERLIDYHAEVRRVPGD
ncbi:MAG: lactate utilization protein C, partial [Solirubrobacteraceae bacterium]